MHLLFIYSLFINPRTMIQTKMPHILLICMYMLNIIYGIITLLTTKDAFTDIWIYVFASLIYTVIEGIGLLYCHTSITYIWFSCMFSGIIICWGLYEISSLSEDMIHETNLWIYAFVMWMIRIVTLVILLCAYVE